MIKDSAWRLQKIDLVLKKVKYYLLSSNEKLPAVSSLYKSDSWSFVTIIWKSHSFQSLLWHGRPCSTLVKATLVALLQKNHYSKFVLRATIPDQIMFRYSYSLIYGKVTILRSSVNLTSSDVLVRAYYTCTDMATERYE